MCIRDSLNCYSLTSSKNITTTGKFIGDGSLITNLPALYPWTTLPSGIVYNGCVGINVSYIPSSLTALSVNGRIYSMNTSECAPPGIGTCGSAGDGTKYILAAGDETTYPYAIGITSWTMWYNVPNGANHVFMQNGSTQLTISSNAVYGPGYGRTTGYASLETKGDGSPGLISIYNSYNARIGYIGHTFTDTSGINYLNLASVSSAGYNGWYLNGSLYVGNTTKIDGTIYANGGENINQLLDADWDSSQVLTNTNTYTTSIKAANGIMGKSIMSYSDRRIKKNIIEIEDDFALQKILQVQCKKYNYIDFTNGTAVVIGFIAQQIKEVIPEAVTIIKDFVPNIFSAATYSSVTDTSNYSYNYYSSNTSNYYSSNYYSSNTYNIITLKNTSNVILNVNDNIKTYDGQYKEVKCTITSNIDSNIFIIDKPINTSNLFVYGTEVKDFHSLNKDYIFTMNVSATQELYKLIVNLQNKVTYLEDYISSNLL